MNINFVLLDKNDIDIIYKWLNEKFVSEWYCKGENLHLKENVIKKYLPRTEPTSLTKSFIINIDNEKIGYIQTYRIIDFPEYNNYVQTDSHYAGIDLFIGEHDYINKGYGSLIISKFLKDKVFINEEIENCIIGPDPKNLRAIKAYKKAGFRYLKIIQVEDEQEYLMIIEQKK
jgi:RimJ/RimL family protein N-acetyltransferase